MSATVEPARSHPCAACPWRTANHGQRHADGWYTKANRRRLWSKLRTGDSMTCHPTDHGNPVPAGATAVPERVQTYECTGALILQQREFMVLQETFKADLAAYRRSRPLGLTKAGIATLVNRFIFGETPLAPALPQLDLGQPVSHDPLAGWEWRTTDG